MIRIQWFTSRFSRSPLTAAFGGPWKDAKRWDLTEPAGRSSYEWLRCDFAGPGQSHGKPHPGKEDCP